MTFALPDRHHPGSGPLTQGAGDDFADRPDGVGHILLRQADRRAVALLLLLNGTLEKRAGRALAHRAEDLITEARSHLLQSSPDLFGDRPGHARVTLPERAQDRRVEIRS